MVYRTSAQRELGATMIEAALTFIVFLALLALVLDGGRYFWFRAMLNEVTDAVLRDSIGIIQQQNGAMDPTSVHQEIRTKLASLGFDEGIKSCLIYHRKGSIAQYDATPNVSDLKLEVSLFQPCLLCKVFPGANLELLRTHALRVTPYEIFSTMPSLPVAGSDSLILMAEAHRTSSGVASSDEYWRTAQPCSGVLTASTP